MKADLLLFLILTTAFLLSLSVVLGRHGGRYGGRRYGGRYGRRYGSQYGGRRYGSRYGGRYGSWGHGGHGYGHGHHGGYGRPKTTQPPPPPTPPTQPPPPPTQPPPPPPPPQICFDDSRVPYVKCSKETTYQPSVCDCKKKDECYIKLTITRNPGITKRGETGNIFSVNGGRIGPTIIIEHHAILAVDVINNIDDQGTSIHWHGMHQQNVPWMDGVANVTQWAIQQRGGKFRYILRAHPTGTHWYHSHVGTQRDEGIFGALIVNEAEEVLEKLSDYPPMDNEDGFEDSPGKHMLAITEHMATDRDIDGKEKRACSEDGSAVPVKGEHVSSFQINGIKLHKKINKTVQEPSYTVEGGKNYRFRVVGAVEQTLTRVSIDGHTLIVISTDSYLTKPFETDAVHVHAGERYDFIVKARAEVPTGTVFPIRVESVEVYCSNHDQPARVGIAYLKYDTTGTGHVTEDRECPTGDCIALNCPFAHYPAVTEGFENAPSYKCFDVYDALSLLIPTPGEELPDDTYPPPATTKFFNHHFNEVARVNNIRFGFPDVPFAMSDGPVAGECPYDTTRDCSKVCPHAVYVQRKHKSKSIEFVLSSLPTNGLNADPVTKLTTHPIHLHGHSFWVTKIAYPEYFANATIESVNGDVEIPDCGYGNWKYNIRQHGIRVDERTIRKDVIIVPAGGYVVIEFLANNPGWWLMHCHIDRHLIGGMGIAVGEVTDCQNPPPPELMHSTREFCWSIHEFRRREKINVCEEKSLKNNAMADEERPNEFEIDEFEPVDYEAEQQNPRALLRELINGRV